MTAALESVTRPAMLPLKDCPYTVSTAERRTAAKRIDFLPIDNENK
jgi:hypothetical protein